MYSKLHVQLGPEKTTPEGLEIIKKIEAYYRIREAMNRFDYGKLLGIDYGGSFGPGSDEYAPEAHAILEYFEQNAKLGKTTTKTGLFRKLLQVHREYFCIKGNPSRCALITEHIYNEMFKLRIFRLSKRSYFFHFYYKKRHTCGWPD